MKCGGFRRIVSELTKSTLSYVVAYVESILFLR